MSGRKNFELEKKLLERKDEEIESMRREMSKREEEIRTWGDCEGGKGEKGTQEGMSLREGGKL